MMMVFSVVGAAFAEPGDAGSGSDSGSGTPTSTLPKADISITGLEAGDGVTLYKVIKWDTSASNWAFDGITVASPYETVDKLLAALAGNDAPAAMTALTTAVASKSAENSVSSLESTTYTYNAEVGMYLALVTTSTANAYNPMVLSVNYDLTSNPATASGSTLASTAVTGTTTLAKKQPITLTKEVTGADKKQDIAAGDTIPYTVTTVTPNYGTNYTQPYFVLTDTLSTGLELTADQRAAITVKYTGTETALEVGEDKDYTINATSSGYTITFTADYLHRIKANTGITVEYTATVTKDANFHQVDEFENTVTAEFSNKPTGAHGSLTEDTHHYTFSIDAELFGNQSGDNITKELKKIAQAFDGSAITQWETTDESSWTSHTALQGAEFTLVGNDHTYSATSGTDGRLTFTGLDAGNYTLTEISAPAGYKFSTTGIPVSISASYNDDGTLKDYTITVNNNISTKYSTTLNGDHISTVTIDDTIKNTAGIKNEPGATLPSTGGIGTTIFYVAGIVLVLGAAAIIIARRKAEQE